MQKFFNRFAKWTSDVTGSKWGFGAAIGIVFAWGLSGPLFHFSDTWQLVINTGTTIVTFLMVFLIQKTQNRDAQSIQLKLDEIILSMKAARNSMIDLEDLSDNELKTLQEKFKRLGQEEPASVIAEAAQDELQERHEGQGEQQAA